MRGVKNFIVVILILVVLSIQVLSAQTISVVEKEKAVEDKVSITQVLMSYWWVGVVIIAILALILWGLFVIIKKIKQGNDVWWQIIKDKKKLCKVHRDSQRVRAFFRFKKNCPIKIYYTNSQKLHSKTVGYYRGHYLSHEGNMCILFNCMTKWLIFPKPDVLFLNVKEELIVNKRVPKQEGRKITMVNKQETLKYPFNFYDFAQEEIIIYAHGVDKDYRTGFFFPVLKDEKGAVINMALPVYESVKQVAIEGYLYDQTDDFVKVTKKSIDLNPMIRGVNKVSDSSSSIETQEQPMRG